MDALRADGAHVPELCLVALDGPLLLGHIFFSLVRLASGHDALALAPMAVSPKRQRSGVGTALAKQSLDMARETGAVAVVVVGHPEYYARFGFEPAAGLGLEVPWPIPPEAWMALRLPAYDESARGLVRYPAAFDAVG